MDIRIMAVMVRDPGRETAQCLSLAITFCGGAIFLLAGTSAFAQVTVTPRVAMSETYSDNVHLEPDATKQADWITSLSPGVDLVQESARSSLDLSYTLQTNFYARNSNSSRVYHYLRANGELVAIKNHLFIDASANRTQQATTLAGPLGIDNSTSTGNVTNVTTASVSPYLKFNLGTLADSVVRVSHDRVYYDQGQADSHSNSASLDLNSGPAFRRLFWNARGYYQDIRSSGPDKGKTSRGALTVGYHLSYSLAPFVTGGYENYNYTTTRSTTEGPFWEAGFRWTPSPRTSFEAAYGHRFYGRNYRLDFKYRRRLSLWHVSYNESLTSARQLLLTNAGQLPVYDPSCPPSQSGCQPAEIINLYDQQVVNTFYLNKEWRGDVTLDVTRRSSLTFGVFRLKRTLELNGTEETRYGGTANWRWELSRRSRFKLSGAWSRNEFGQPRRQDKLWSVVAVYGHDLGRNADASLTYRHQSRLSNQALAQYDENAVIASVSMRF